MRVLRSPNETISPAIALAATVGGLASQTLPGPERPEKLRLIALIVTSSACEDTPGPHRAQAPQARPSHRPSCLTRVPRASGVPDRRRQEYGVLAF